MLTIYKTGSPFTIWQINYKKLFTKLNTMFVLQARTMSSRRQYQKNYWYFHNFQDKNTNFLAVDTIKS